MASQEVEEGYKKALAELKAVEAKYRGKPLTAQGFQELKKARNKVGLYTKQGAIGRGIGRAATDVITGIPDLAAMGINYGIRKASDSEQPFQLPVLGEEFRKAVGAPEQELDPRNQFAADVPGYVAAAVGVKQLLQLGWKGLKSLRNSSKMKKLLGELPVDEANAFKQYMVRGQGSDSPLVQSAIERMRSNTEYKELFTALEEGAAKAGSKVATVRPSKQTAEEATAGATRSVEKAVAAVKKARDEAGAVNFDMALRMGGSREIVAPDDTIKALNNLRTRFKTDTPEGEAALRYIDQLEASFAARIPMQGGGELVLGSIKPKLTVEQIQNKLREFGSQIGSSDAAVNSLSVNTKDIINKAVFGGMKSDLMKAGSRATSEADKKAIGYLAKARDQYSKGTQAYTDLIAKGVPKFLRDTPVNEIELSDLTKAYEGLSDSQRKLFRTWVGENRAESLQAIDKAVFDSFKNKAFKMGADGKQTYDLGALAREWERILKTDKEKAAMIADALGVNASEFSSRMKDALVFTRKMDVGTSYAAERAIKGQPQAAALAGSIGGYPAAKVTDLTIEALNTMMKKQGISDEMLMKMLLTKEGADFLKTAKISPQGRETLEKLVGLNRATVPETVSWLMGGRGVMPETATQQQETVEEIVIPDELPAEFGQQAGDEEIVIPDEIPEESLQPSDQGDPLGDFIKQRLGQSQQSNVNQQLMDRIKRTPGISNPEYAYNAIMTGDPKQRDFILQNLNS